MFTEAIFRLEKHQSARLFLMELQKKGGGVHFSVGACAIFKTNYNDFTLGNVIGTLSCVTYLSTTPFYNKHWNHGNKEFNAFLVPGVKLLWDDNKDAENTPQSLKFSMWIELE